MLIGDFARIVPPFSSLLLLLLRRRRLVLAQTPETREAKESSIGISTPTSSTVHFVQVFGDVSDVLLQLIDQAVGSLHRIALHNQFA